MRANTRVVLILGFCALSLRADLVVMQNGDRYSGKLLSMTSSNLVLQSENLGKVTLARAKVANISFGTNAVAATIPAIRPASNQPAVDTVSPMLRQLGSHSNLIQKVQEQFLGAASPEASAKFQSMLNDLSSGKMTMADLRAQAKSVADQLRELQRESGEDGGVTADLYLSILDNFLETTAPTAKAGTNAPAGR